MSKGARKEATCVQHLQLIPVLLAILWTHVAIADEPPVTTEGPDEVSIGLEFLLSSQEGPAKAEWPYEGVYRVREDGRPVIPIGYRVGGTALVSTALLHLPAGDSATARDAALARAVTFICRSTDEPLMQWSDYDGGYDVRGWGYIYALSFLCDLQRVDAVPEGMDATVQQAIEFYAKALQQIAIPDWGGWNYSRNRNVHKPGPQAPFMTGPALQALFAAAERGLPIDADTINAALDALERSRSTTGAVEYSGGPEQASPDTHAAGAAGRMLSSETTLLLAGRGSAARVRGALDSFLAFWDELEARRSKTGTHKGPYGVAPYYFFFAHYYAAQAIELLPEPLRREYREPLRRRLEQVRMEDGRWNDRVFPRSASYGTALALLSLNMSDIPPPSPWSTDTTSTTTTD